MLHKLVVIESPYKGDIKRNEAYARAALRDCISRGESPYASHLLLTQPGVLDDSNPEEREKGIAAGLAWQDAADLIAVYEDYGITEGMQRAITRAKKLKIPIDYRTIL